MAQLRLIEDGADEQDGIRAPRARFVDLVLVEDEIFAQHRYLYGLLDDGQIGGRAEKKVRFRKHRDGGGSVRLVGARYLQRIESRREQALRGRGAFDLGNQLDV